jgi:hypothetical protein
LAVTVEAELAWHDKANLHAVRMLTWTNPQPGKAMKRIVFSTNHPYASPILLGVTLLDCAEAK